MTNGFPEIVTIGETAQYLRISQSFLDKLTQDGRITYLKVEQHWQLRREAIDRWL